MADIRINALATTATTPASDDYLALDGTAQGTRKILATNIANNVTDVILGASGPSVKSTLSARAPRQGLVFDGTGYASFSAISAFGQGVAGSTAGDFSFAAWVYAPSSIDANAPALVGGPSSSLTLRVHPSGQLQSTCVNVADNAISTRALSLGKWNFVTYRRSGTSAYYGINGVEEASITDSQNYSNGCTLLGQLNAGYPSNFIWAGSILQPLIYNRALSASEVVALYEAGAPAGADYNTAGTKTTTFNSGASSAVQSGTSATGGTLTFAGPGAGGLVWTLPQVSQLLTGQKYVVTFTATLTSGAVPVVLLNDIGIATRTNTATVVAGANSHTLTVSSASTTGSIGLTFFTASGASTFTISNITVTAIGLLLAPDAAQAGGGYVWNDQSGNLAQIVLPSSGVQWNLPSVAGQRIRGTTSTNGNQQLLGASVLLPAECQITHVRARARSGTPTITIGTASGGAQIVASVALSTTWLNCTIALTGGIVSSADDIWVGSNSTDVVETDIAFQPLDF